MFQAHQLFSTPIAFALLLMASTAVAAPVDISADTISRTADGVVIAQGHVIIKREFDTLTADEVTYRTKQHVLEAKGNVSITSDKSTIHAEQAIMHTNSKTGHMHNAVITLPGGERLTAKRIKRIDDQTYEAEEIIFSACPIDEESWRIAASRAVLDQQDGSLTTSHPRFELWQIPVLYAPWWQQPLKRKSGLLMPKVNSGKRRGTEISLPYYLAPANNWDATISPHWMSARGVMGELELRHISPFGHEQINVEGVRDAVTASNRSRLQGELHWQLPANMNLEAQADHVSDHDYLADYAGGDVISSAYLQSFATLSQSGQYRSFKADWSAQVQHQQNLLRPDNSTTLQILPRFQSNMQWSPRPDIRLHFDHQSTRFDRSTGVDGWRMNLHPYLEIPLQLAGGGLSATFMAGAQHTRYWLQQTNLADRSPSRTSREASLEIRSDFEKVGGHRNWRHVISPIARYDYIDAPNQAKLPNFDSGFGLLTWNNLLSGNRYSGFDRIEKTSRFSLMLESRLQLKAAQDAAIRDALIVRAGISYDLLRTSVDSALQAAPTRPFSNLLAEIIWQPVAGMRLYSSGQYNAVDRYWANMVASINIVSSPGNRLRLGYRFTDARYAAPVQLLDASASASLNNRWLATGSWQYDLRLKFSQRTSLGVQYRHPCWKLGIEGYNINSRSGTTSASNLGFRLLLEFKGLGSVGS